MAKIKLNALFIYKIVFTFALYSCILHSSIYRFSQNFVFSNSYWNKIIPVKCANRCAFCVYPIAKNNGIRGIRCRYNLSCGESRHVSHFRSETDERLHREVRRRLRECILHGSGKATCTNNLYRNIETSAETYSSENIQCRKKRANTRATITHGSRERWKLHAAKARQIN